MMGDRNSENLEGGEEIPEPEITSSDPNERKLARSLRIERRLEAIRKHNLSDEDTKAELQEEKTLLEKQIETSTNILEKLLQEGEEIVTNVRIGDDAREVQRRKKEEIRKAELVAKLDEEATLAKEMFDTIYEKWENISKYKDPLDLHESIMMQKDQCDELIKQKDDIISMLKEEVNSAELKFSNDQEVQEDDISTIVKRIDRQVELMHDAYKNELKLIEETIAEERKMLIEANNKKWEALHKQCSEQEKANVDERLNQIDEYLEAFYKLRVENEEEYRRMKISLESNTEQLEQELEHLKALCLLNSEKLGYNYQMLKKREEENMILKSQQKRLINKMQDEINLIKKKIDNYKFNSEIKITKLTNDIKKLRNNILDVEAKAKHFGEINERKFKQVWELNLDTINELLDDIQTIDKVIYEQLLGLEWKKGKHKILKLYDLPSYKLANHALTEEFEQNRVPELPFIMKSSNNEINETICKKILEKISFRSNMVIESKLNEIIKTLSIDHENLVRIDKVLAALNIITTEEMNVLMIHFFPYLHCPICDKIAASSHAKLEADSKAHTSVLFGVVSADNESFKELPSIMSAVHQNLDDVAILVKKELDTVSNQDDDDFTETQNAEYSSEKSYPTVTSKTIKPSALMVQCKRDHPLVIPGSSVFRVIREYLEKHNKNMEKTKTISEKLAKRFNTISRLLTIEDIEQFWNQFQTVFSKEDEDLWNCLLFGLKKYHTILEDRHKIYAETEKLRKQNTELRHLLKNCTPRSKKSSSKPSSGKSSQTDLTRDI